MAKAYFSCFKLWNFPQQKLCAFYIASFKSLVRGIGEAVRLRIAWSFHCGKFHHDKHKNMLLW